MPFLCTMKRLVLISGIVIILQSCAPSLSQYQTAATLGEGNNSNSIILEHTFENLSNPIDLSVGYMHTNGVSNDLDLGFGFGLNNHLNIAGGFHVKRSIVKDKFSINFPVLFKRIDETFNLLGVIEYNDEDNIRVDITPTMLYTYNSNNKSVKNTFNLQYVIQISAFDVFNNAIYLSHNWEIKTKKLYIYPEIGIQMTNDQDPIMKAGIGFSLKNIKLL